MRVSEHLVDVRTPLAASPIARVEMGGDGVLHVLAGPVTLSLDRAACEELATTLARAMVTLSRIHPRRARPPLSLVRAAPADDLTVPADDGKAP